MRFTRQVQQPDGSTLTIKLVGDELFSYYATVDGVPVKKQQDGSYVYARCQAGHFIPTTALAHDLALRSVGEQALASSILATPIVRSEKAEEIALGNTSRRARRAPSSPNQVGTSSNHKGEKKGIIILVNFPDKQMVYSREDFDAQMNQNNYNKNGHIGSLADYFYDQSYGQLSIEFDVVGPYTVSQEMAYYGAHTDNDNDSHPGQMVAEAIHLADKDVDYSRYDWDGDGMVDQVFVIYAGYAEAQGGPDDTIWPHEWSLYAAYYYGSSNEGSIRTDGVVIDTYACSSELASYRGASMAGIGTAAHEFSHCMGLPDFYDTDYSGGIGMDEWSLMCSGSYNSNACVPAPYTSYERWFSGWMEPVELDDPCWVKEMKHIVTTPEAYIIYNQRNRNEYYMLENHQRTGSTGEYRNWDRGLSGHGMLVMHIDYNSQRWQNNKVNDDPTHQRFTFISADGKNQSSAATPYPGTRNNHALTNTTTPAAKLFNKNLDGTNFLNRPIEDITEANGMINFKFNGGMRITSPEMHEAIAVTDTSFTIQWDAISGAESYDLELKDMTSTEQKPVLKEDLANNPLLTKGGTLIASKINDYLESGGWTATRVYTGVGSLCLGQFAASGVLQSALQTAPSDGQLTLKVGLKTYGSKANPIKVSLLSEQESVLFEQELTPTSESTVHTMTCEKINEPYFIRLESAKQVYLTYVEVLALPDPLLISDVTDTKYTFTGLTPATTYAYRARSVTNGTKSEWSDYEEVTLKKSINIFAPELVETTAVTDSSFTVQWSVVPEAESYEVELKALTSPELTSLIKEDLANNPLLTKNGSLIDSKIDNYLEADGWTASRVYTGVGALCLGQFAASGSLQSALHDAPANGRLTLKVGLKTYGSNANPLYVYVANEQNIIMYTQELTPTKEGEVHTLECEEIDEPYYVLLMSTRQVYLTYLEVQTLTDTFLFTDITDTEYTFQGLTGGATYAYRVRSLCEDMESPWSESIEVVLPEPISDGIDTPALNHTAQGVWYNLSGQRVNSPQRGVYIRNKQKVMIP